MQFVFLRREVAAGLTISLRWLVRLGIVAALPVMVTVVPLHSLPTEPNPERDVAGNALAMAPEQRTVEADRETACTPLARLAFYVDGKAAQFGMPLSDGNSTLVPVREAIIALSAGNAEIAPVGPSDTEIRVVSGGQTRMRIPLIPKVKRKGVATPAAQDTVAQVGGANIPVDEPSAWVMYGGVSRPMMDLYALSGLFGAAVNEVGETVQITTPVYWRRALGLDERNSLPDVLQSLANRPDFGASPPAKNVLLWTRARKAGYLQMYFLGASAADDYSLPDSEAIRPLLGKDPLSEERVFLSDVTNGDPMVWQVNGPQRIFGQSLYYEDDPAKQMDLGEDGPKARFARYAVVWSAKNPGTDMVKAIRSGQIGQQDWCVVGIRHRVGKLFAPFEIIKAEPGKTVTDIANDAGMPVEFLRAANGLEPDERIFPGEQLAVLKPLKENELQRLRIAAGLPAFDKPTTPPPLGRVISVEVQPGDTLESLSHRCGISEARLREEAGLAVGEELRPGAQISLRLARDESLPPVPNPVRPLPTSTNVGKYMRVDSEIPVYERTGFNRADRGPVVTTLSKMQRVYVRRRFDSLKLAEVAFTEPIDGSGYIRSIHLKEDDGPPNTPNQPAAPGRSSPTGYSGSMPTVSPQALPRAQQIIEEALKWERVPRYVWGGDDIARGIDCSHFVAAVYKRVGQPCPEPPVRNMEQCGNVVHWRPDLSARMGDNPFPLPPATPRQWPQPGDRIIFQSSGARGRHTGIYIGQFRGMEHAYIHCNGGRKTVTVDELTRTNWRIYKYTCRGTQRRRTGSLVEVENGPAKRIASVGKGAAP